MSSKADKKRTKKARGSSKAGRPRKLGERFPGGKLKTPGLNATVIARRKAGDSEAGEHPMDFALSQGWVTERDHLSAKAYLAAFNRAHIGGPTLSHGGLCEAVPSETLRMNWSQMSDEEIVAIFDQVFNAAQPEDQAKLEAGALGRWKLMNAALTGEERAELFTVCVLGSWPFWMPKRAADHVLGQKDARKLTTLMNALGAVSRALRPAKPKTDTITPLPHKATRAGRAESPVRYETQDGDEITPTSRRGTPFEVTVLRRRA